MCSTNSWILRSRPSTPPKKVAIDVAFPVPFGSPVMRKSFAWIAPEHASIFSLALCMSVRFPPPNSSPWVLPLTDGKIPTLSSRKRTSSFVVLPPEYQRTYRAVTLPLPRGTVVPASVSLSPHSLPDIHAVVHSWPSTETSTLLHR